MRWLITGGCGFIGRNLVRVLLDRTNDSFRVLDDLSVGTRERLAAVHPVTDPGAGARLELMVGDVRDAETTQRAAAGCDAVVHLAANTGVAPSVADPMADCVTNVIGIVNVLEACRHHGIHRFVFASSGAAVGDCTPPLHEGLPTRPVSPYGASKLAGEAYCSAYRRSFGLDTVALRFGNVYGPLSGQKDSVVAKFIRLALAGEPWDIYGDGRQTRDFIFADDICAAIIAAASAPGVGGEVFQIATSAETTVLELVDALAAALRRRGIATPTIRHASPRTGDVMRNFSDTSKARDRLGWTAQVPLASGLDRTIEWFLAARAED